MAGRRDVTLPVDDVGALLTEVSRAFLNGGAPCALLGRVIAGCEAFETQATCIEDRDFVRVFRSQLVAMRAQWRRNAEHVYSADATANRYYTLVIPFTEENRTEWHPTDRTGPFAVITRGMFKTEGEAHTWAKEHIPGTAYSVRSNVADDVAVAEILQQGGR